jgi:hypothetical protein
MNSDKPESYATTTAGATVLLPLDDEHQYILNKQFHMHGSLEDEIVIDEPFPDTNHPLTKKPWDKAGALDPVPLSRDSIEERRELCGIGGSPVGSPGRATSEKEVVIGRSNSAPTTIYEIHVAKSGEKEQKNSLFRTKPCVEKNEKIWLHVMNSLLPKDKKDRPTETSESPF